MVVRVGGEKTALRAAALVEWQALEPLARGPEVQVAATSTANLSTLRLRVGTTGFGVPPERGIVRIVCFKASPQ